MQLVTTKNEFEAPDLSGDFYEILGVARGANKETITQAYRRLASKLHPDKLAPNIDKELARKAFETVQKAYENLSDPVKRAFYDQTGMTVIDPNLMEKTATAIVTDKLVEVCAAVCGDASGMSEKDVARFDVVASASQSLRDEIKNNLRAQGNMAGVIAKLQIITKRLHRKNRKFEDTEVGSSLLKDIKDVKKALGDSKNRCVILGRAIEMLKDYGYDVEEDPPVSRFSFDVPSTKSPVNNPPT